MYLKTCFISGLDDEGLQGVAHCLKITQNVAFEFFLILTFSTNFCPIKTDLSGNTI